MPRRLQRYATNHAQPQNGEIDFVSIIFSVRLRPINRRAYDYFGAQLKAIVAEKNRMPPSIFLDF